MRRTITSLCAAAMAATSVAAFAGASQAAPIPAISVQSDSNVVQVRDEGRFERRGDFYYYNGHRGDRRRHEGWREHNGYWFPPAAFLGGVIIGNALADRPVVVYRGGRNHVRWCYNHRPNYRASDNTWKPYGGYRRACHAPFD